MYVISPNYYTRPHSTTAESEELFAYVYVYSLICHSQNVDKNRQVVLEVRDMATCHEGVRRSEDTGPRILSLATRRSVVSFTPRPLCPRGKELLAPIKQGAGRTQQAVRKF